jgi:hypothetical protein
MSCQRRATDCLVDVTGKLRVQNTIVVAAETNIARDNHENKNTKTDPNKHA